MSMSLRIGTPALAAATKAGSCIETPGLNMIWLALRHKSCAKSPKCIGVFGCSDVS